MSSGAIMDTRPRLEDDRARDFLSWRKELLALGYRLTGSLAEAEDIAQEAYLRWQTAAQGRIANPRAFLRKVVTHLALDHLRSARHRREVYVGPWLPEPVVEAFDAPQHEVFAERQEVSMALMLALERLSPSERATFVLHELFAVPFSIIATILERSEAACRKLAERAREHVRLPERRQALSPEHKREWAMAFYSAAHEGKPDRLAAMLNTDATLLSDGGGVRLAAINTITGAERIARFFTGLTRKHAHFARAAPEFAIVNGLPGYVTIEVDGLPQTTALDIDDGRISAIYVMRNPEKLTRLSIGSGHHGLGRRRGHGMAAFMSAAATLAGRKEKRDPVIRS
jgi:RNA polymerase sigma-70 factor (ECF subfamily)